MTPTPTPVTDSPQIAPAGVVGRGHFTTSGNTTTGQATVTSDGAGNFTLTVSSFHTTQANKTNLSLNFTPWPVTTPCLADEDSLSLGTPDASGSVTVPLSDSEGDPSYFQTLVLTTVTGNAGGAAGCINQPLAFAPISWSMIDTRPSLHASDGGSRMGATGTVVGPPGGPTSYLVATGDNLTSLAARFGVSVDDLRFLNPFDSLALQQGQSVNLDPSKRGAGSLTPPPH